MRAKVTAMAVPDRLLVAAGLIIDGDRVLLAQRPQGKDLAGYWELPGGKVEPGESPVGALKRELREELAVDVEVGWIWHVLHHQYARYEVVLLVYPCRLRPGSTPISKEVANFAWCGLADLRQYDVLSADAPMVQRLLIEGLPEVANAPQV